MRLVRRFDGEGVPYVPPRETVPGPGLRSSRPRIRCCKVLLVLLVWLKTSGDAAGTPGSQLRPRGRDGSGREGQATVRAAPRRTGATTGASAAAARWRSRPTNHLGASRLGHGLGQSEADAGDVGLLAEAQAGRRPLTGRERFEGGVAEMSPGSGRHHAVQALEEVDAHAGGLFLSRRQGASSPWGANGISVHRAPRRRGRRHQNRVTFWPGASSMNPGPLDAEGAGQGLEGA